MAITVPMDADSKLAMIGRPAVWSMETMSWLLELPKMKRKLSSVGCSGNQCRFLPAAVHSSTGLKAIVAIQTIGISTTISASSMRL